jgi:hypothetical protein
LELGVSGQRLLQERDRLRAYMAGVVGALLPTFELVARTGIGRPVLEVIGAEFAPFHELNAGDLSQEVMWRRGIHDCTYYSRVLETPTVL